MYNSQLSIKSCNFAHQKRFVQRMINKPNTSIQMIADYEGDIKNLFEFQAEGEIPILATRNLVLFPGVMTPILVGRPASINLINKLKKNPDIIFAIFCQKGIFPSATN
jgi:ATP-dependent Lon protease